MSNKFHKVVATPRCGYLLVCVALMAGVGFTYAAEPPVIDCPLREEAYSIKSPLMDILLKPQAKAVANRHLDGSLDKLPSFYASTEAPSFSAIITLETIAAMAQLPSAALVPLDQELAVLEITTADRVARCARYDAEVPDINITEGEPRLLVFEKMTGFRDGPSVEAARAALLEMAERNGWAVLVTDKAGAMTPEILQQFDAVIWNNVSGDVLTLTQRNTFKDYIENGGGYVGIHGSGGDPIYFWDWYVDELIGARFIGHPSEPQFQDAQLVVEKTTTGIERGLPGKWTMKDEWYSFKSSPRDSGATVIASLDESTYKTVGRYGQELAMGDHPIAWAQCVGSGRAFYSAIGHLPETYTEPNHVKLLEQGISWAAGLIGPDQCSSVSAQ